MSTAVQWLHMDQNSNDQAPKPDCVCPECGHRFRGNGFDGIDAHWRAKHEAVIPYSQAWPLIKSGNYIRMNRGNRVRVKKFSNEKDFRGKTGTVIADCAPGQVILLGMDDEDETMARQFSAEDLEQINERKPD